MLSKITRIPFSLSKTVYIYFALLLLLVPIRLLFAAAVSAAIHELFHIAAICFMGIQIHSIHIGVRGARIHTEPMTGKEELLCSLAGPLSGFLLLFLFRRMPVIALTGAIQSLYNLLPLYPTDGGRALQCCAKLILPHGAADKMIYTAEIITLSAVMALGVYGSVWLRLGILPAALAVSLLLQSAKQK